MKHTRSEDCIHAHAHIEWVGPAGQLEEKYSSRLLPLINPRRACAARITVLGSVCVCVCLSVKSHLTYGASVRPENAVTYSAGNEGQKICGDLPETTAFKSYATKHERKSQYANYSDLPMSAFSA